MEANCLIIAGEKSGEEHCLSFYKKLKEGMPELKFWGVGGDELESEGMELLYHLKDFSSWGFSEVIGKIPFYFNALKKIEEEVEKRKTKVAILIDFQDFNLRLAKKLSKKGVEVLYYVAPQAWAWKAYRAGVLQETVNTLFTIIPFEKKWFSDRGVKKVRGVEHPLYRTYAPQLNTETLGLKNKPFENFSKRGVRLLLLPGSRNFEVKGLLREFNKTIHALENDFSLEVGLVPSPNVKKSLFEELEVENLKIFDHDDLASALEWCDVSLAASGTVTLATALFQVPTVVCYETSLLNEFIFFTFLDYGGFISLANIVHQKEVFPELIQERSTAFNMQKELLNWLGNEKMYTDTKVQLAKTADLLKGEAAPVEEDMLQVLRGAYALK